MEGNRVLKASVFLAAAAIIASAGVANAQVTAADASCRATIQKNSGKLGGTTMKTIDGCIKSVLGAKLPPTTNCNSWPAADSKGKVAATIGKLQAGIPVKCLAIPANVAGKDCPSPADADDGVDGVTSVSELANCQATLNTDSIEPLRSYILNPNAALILAHPNVKNIVKCANSIGKGATKLWSTLSKERGKCQNTSDKVPGAYEYSCQNYDASLKIAGAVTKLQDGIQKSCGDTLLTQSELSLIGSCASTVAGIKTCVANAVKKNADGATSLAYEFAEVCPTEVKLVVNGGATGGQRKSATSLDTGWTGFGHDADVVDGFTGKVSINCSSDDCSSCAVTANCEMGNCRCSNNSATVCNTPFVQDVCGAGNTCIVHFGPPLPLAAGGVATCVVNTIATPFTGNADIGTGESTTAITNNAKVYLGISQTAPCPICSGATIGAAGTCSGGARAGLGCTTNAINTSFGNTSYDCPPAGGSNVTGAGLIINLTLTDGAVSLPFGDSCDSPLGAFACACGACQGDPSKTCNADADCTGGTGPCSNAGGTPRQPNGCSDLTCNPDPASGTGEGTCNAGPVDAFCDGFTKTNGEGYLPCTSDADCTPLAAGSCTMSKRRDCYLNPITADGVAGQDGAELVSAFCSAPTASASVNSAAGIPGAGRIRLDMDFTGYCPDGLTEFELGGANCP